MGDADANDATGEYRGLDVTSYAGPDIAQPMWGEATSLIEQAGSVMEKSKGSRGRRDSKAPRFSNAINGDSNESTPLMPEATMSIAHAGGSVVSKNEISDILRKLDETAASLRQSFEMPEKHNPTRTPKLGPGLTRRLLVMTFVWQVVNVASLTALDTAVDSEDLRQHNTADEAVFAGILTMAGFQSIHLFVLIASTIKLAKQLVHHTASNNFLAQSYMSTILLYTGIYTLLHRCDKGGWDGMDAPEGNFSNHTYILKTFIILLYFSTSTMTSVGYGDIHPNAWYLYLLTSTQMLIGMLYSVAILGRGLDALNSGTRPSFNLGSKRRKSKSEGFGGDLEGSRGVTLEG